MPLVVTGVDHLSRVMANATSLCDDVDVANLRRRGGEEMRYRIVVGGRVSARVVRFFPGFEAVPHGDTTDLVGEVTDQTELFGVLERVRGFGLVVVSLGPMA